MGTRHVCSHTYTPSVPRVHFLRAVMESWRIQVLLTLCWCAFQRSRGTVTMYPLFFLLFKYMFTTSIPYHPIIWHLAEVGSFLSFFLPLTFQFISIFQNKKGADLIYPMSRTSPSFFSLFHNRKISSIIQS